MGRHGRALHFEQEEDVARLVAEGLEVSLSFGDDQSGFPEAADEVPAAVFEQRSSSRTTRSWTARSVDAILAASSP